MIKQTGRLVGACRFVLAGDGLTLTNVHGLPLKGTPFKFCRGIQVRIVASQNITGQKLQLGDLLHKHRCNGNERADTFPVRDFLGNDYGIFQSITVTFQFVAEKTEMDGVTTDLMWRDKGRDTQHRDFGHTVQICVDFLQMGSS